jgi:hypothetical protein
VRVHGHVVIIAGTRAEVTPRHDFVIRVVDGAELGPILASERTVNVPGSALRSGPGSTDRSHPAQPAHQRTNPDQPGPTWR